MTPNDAASAERVIYRSSSGDVWALVASRGGDPRQVEHRPNAASGGRTQRFSIEEFLAGHDDSPEHHALRVMLESETATAAHESPGAEIELRHLGPDETPPEGEDYVLVMQGLSGEQRIILNLSGMSHVSGHSAALLPSETFCNSEVEALSRARELAGEYGLAAIYMRDDV